MAWKWRLAAVMADREINYKKLAELTGLHPGTVSKIKNHMPERMDMETLDKICLVLDCEIWDLLVHVKERGRDGNPPDIRQQFYDDYLKRKRGGSDDI